ncbi:hypothetical protein LRH25_10375 [Ideonella azotifigens]|uniref:BON domain-containing protein n=1 Tax=Ideonella azotifigens TaxID=513160 RepID=A0ABN1KEC8_9BURK|nr:hypothetical protein [Ideonella azotifigens]MCD2340749.1 hypothetical protein [Ideonella azotifigens]
MSTLGAALVLTLLGTPAQAEDVRRNWFGDPFFPLVGTLTGCPAPLGPLLTEAERRVQAHHRAEKGTTCWLAGKCDTPSAYAHDDEIAAALEAAWREQAPASVTRRPASVWATVQARVVYFEGCAGDPAAAAELEAFARRLPQVLNAVAALRTDPRAKPPYRTAAGQ